MSFLFYDAQSMDRIALMIRKGMYVLVMLLGQMLATGVIQAETGTLRYPGMTYLNPAAGTVECWVRLGFDPRGVLPQQEHKGLATLLHVGDNSTRISMFYFAGGSAAPGAAWTLTAAPKPPMLPVSIHRVVWTPGDWHHVAITWEGRDMSLYLDGTLVKTRSQNVSFASVLASLTDTAIAFGDPYGKQGRVILDELRISLVARQVEELGYHHDGPLQPDPYTAVLDPLDGGFTPNGNTYTQPWVAISDECGLPSRHCRFVKGRYGQGLALFEK